MLRLLFVGDRQKGAAERFRRRLLGWSGRHSEHWKCSEWCYVKTRNTSQFSSPHRPQRLSCERRLDAVGQRSFAFDCGFHFYAQGFLLFTRRRHLLGHSCCVYRAEIHLYSAHARLHFVGRAGDNEALVAIHRYIYSNCSRSLGIGTHYRISIQVVSIE